VAGATVFYDANNNGVLDPGELSTITAADGSYHLAVPANGSGQLVAFGGTDTSTGLPVTAIVTAPADSSMITPETSLVNALMQQNPGVTEVQANYLVAKALGYSPAVDPEHQYILAGALAGDANAAAAFGAEVKVATMLEQTTGLLGGVAGAPPSAALSKAFFASLGNLIVGAGSGPLPLASASEVQMLIQGAADQAGVTVDPAVVTGAATVLAGVNQHFDSIPVSATTGFLDQVIQTQVVGEGTIAPKLAQVAANQLDINTVIAQETGSAFSSQVATAQVGRLTSSGAVDNVLSGFTNLYGSQNLDADSAFIHGLYRTILNRAPEDAGMMAWLNALHAGQTREQVAYGIINSPEHRSLQVGAYYQTLLNRAPDAGAQAWVDLLRNGGGEAAVVAGILASPEYQQLHPDNAAFVNQVFLNLLGRGASSYEMGVRTSSLQGGISRSVLALSVALSQESSQLVVNGDYLAYLSRKTDDQAAGWVGLLDSSAKTIGQVAAEILGDSGAQEFYGNGKAFVS
jgi:hypothetical protein